MRSGRLYGGGVLVGVLVAAGGSGGCSSMNNTEKGVGLGAMAGAGLGTAVGALTHNPKTGAVVGGLVGAGVGGAVGNSMDRQDQQKREDRQAVAVASAQATAAAQRMGMIDVAKMAQGGFDDQVIINQIRSTGSSFQLTPSDLEYLKAQNVSDRVIIEMQNSRPQPVVVRPRTVVVQDQPTVIYRDPPPVVYAPGPPVFVGGYYGRRW